MISYACSRRRALQMIAFASGATLLSACTGQAPGATNGAVPASGSASTAATASPQTSNTPVARGTLRVGQLGDVNTLDPSFSSSLFESIYAIHDRLSAYNVKHEPQPMLAQSWDASSDDTQITINIRQGVQFHTGRELTSDDVKWNVERLQSGGFNGQLQSMAKWWTSITQPDKYTIVLQSDAPRPAMFDFFEQVNITDPVTAQGAEANSKVVGTGPFAFSEWVQGDHLTLIKNHNYWRAGFPLLDGIKVTIVPDSQALAVQFESGSLDVMSAQPPGPPVADFVRLKADPRYVGLLHPDSGAVQTIGVSAPKPPFDNKLVRQAFNWAVDRQRYNGTILQNTGIAGSLPWGPNSPAYDATKDSTYHFDLDKAKSLLQQAGVSTLEIDLITLSGSAETDAFNQVYQADLATIGVKVNIKPMELAAWVDTVNNVKYFGVWVGGIAYTQLEPSTALLSSRGLAPTANSSGFVSDRYTQLVTASASEPDPAKRKQLYQQINDILLDESFLIILSKTPSRLITRATVHGLVQTLHGTFSPTEAWIGQS